MLKPRLILAQRSPLAISQWLCPSCQFRLHQPLRQASTAAKIITPSAAQNPNKPTPKPREPPPIAPKDENFKPKPLPRPIGQPDPPKPGQNSGIDNRTWRERRDDFFNYDKHLERREKLTHKVSRPYFRDWTSMRYHKGKLFLSSPKLFKAETALYFPNMQGYTLANTKAMADTTSVFQGKISIVSVYSGLWAENQTKTFVGKEQNPALDAVVQEGREDGVQRVWINIEETWMRAGLVRLFVGGLRKMLGREEWGRYFVVRRGLEDVRYDIGMVNAKIGYVYLVDGNCKIRWAGSGDAEAGEGEGLVAGVRRLVDVARGAKAKEMGVRG